MTIFDDILAGKVTCHRVYEDSQILAFLDVAPLSPGHTLVIPKQRATTLDALSDDTAAALGRVLPRICRAILGATGCEAYNLLQNNGQSAHQGVMHVHFHIIPKMRDGAGLAIDWQPGKLDPQMGAALAEKLRGQLGAPTEQA